MSIILSTTERLTYGPNSNCPGTQSTKTNEENIKETGSGCKSCYSNEEGVQETHQGDCSWTDR